MDPFLARTMIESLSKGINPVTGCALPRNDICSNEDVQNALLEVLEHCTIESTEQYLVRIKKEKREKVKSERERNVKRYSRGGEPWSTDEEAHMMSLHRSGYNIYQIANVLKRTPGAISERMKKLQMKSIYRTRK